MCGIVTAYSSQGSLQISDHLKGEMLDSIAYRGLDGSGFWKDDHIAFGHTRLTIIDLSSGGQPMQDHSGRYVIIFNGEIYNYLELKKDYQSQGCSFKTTSDTEVILEGFKLKGEKVLDDLNGMFAFCLWDREEKRLLVARDRLGKKPLYWTKKDGVFYFSSSIKSFLSFTEQDLNLSYLEQVKIFGSCVDNSTPWKNIYSFPFASYAYLDSEKDFVPHKYWQLSFAKDNRSSKEDFLQEYEDILTDAIRIRLRSDVPLCLTFSGGVDSGTIACIASKKLKQDIKLFCIDYDAPDDQSAETAQAKEVASLLELPLQHINYDYKTKMLEDFEEAYKNFDAPCMQFALVYSSVLYRHIHPHAKVVLSGNGADELFTGYIGDERSYFKNSIYKTLKPVADFVPFLKRHSIFAKGFIQHYISQCLNNSDLDAEIGVSLSEELEKAKVKDYYDLQMYMSLFYGARDSNFGLPDVTGYSNQVEVRSLYLDYRMAEFAARLPLKYKINLSATGQMTTKYLPKLYYEKYVPRDLARASKKGMGYNFAWHHSIAKDALFHGALKTALQGLDNLELMKESFKDQLDDYCQQIHQGATFGSNGDKVMFGFMLGTWLKRYNFLGDKRDEKPQSNKKENIPC